MSWREVIRLVSGAAASWPLLLQAQNLPVIGFLSARSQETSANLIEAFRAGLSELKLIEGHDWLISFQWVKGQYDRLPTLAAELVRQRVSVIAAFGGVPPARAAQAASASIPIVFTTAGDPVAEGLVESMNHPGGNATGVSFYSAALGGKMLNLLTTASHAAGVIGVLINPAGAQNQEQLRPVHDAAVALSVEIKLIEARTDADLEHVFTASPQVRLAGLIIVADQFLGARADQIAHYTKQRQIPAISVYRQFAVAGGLMSYGASINQAYRQAGIYVGRILKGEKPSELPIVQPTKFDLTVNLKSARAFGLEFPPTLLALADEVIE